MRDPPSTKGITMIINLLLAIAILLALGVAVNVIGELVTKK